MHEFTLRPAVIYLQLLSYFINSQAQLHLAAFRSTTTAEQRERGASLHLPGGANITWIESDLNSSLSTTAALTNAWASHKFDVLFGVSGQCSTLLELAAAWNVAAFSYKCSEGEMVKLRKGNDLYWSHIRMDVTPFSLLPYIHHLIVHPHVWSANNQTARVLLTAANRVSIEVTTQMLVELRARGVRVNWCLTNCTHDSKDMLLVVYGSHRHLNTWTSRNILLMHEWKAVILASDDPVNPNESLDRIHINNLYSLQPTPLDQSSEQLSRESFDWTELADSIKIYIGRHDAAIGSSHSSVHQATRQIVDGTRSKCYKSTLGLTYCLDDKNWNLGRFSLYSYPAIRARCKNSSQGIFNLVGHFIWHNQTQSLQLDLAEQSCAGLDGNLNVSKPNTIDQAENNMEYVGVLIAVCAVLSIVLLLGIVVFLYYKLGCYKQNEQATIPSWQIASTDISPFRQEVDEVEFGTETLQDIECMFGINGCSAVTDFGYYKDQPVALKRWCSNGLLMSKARHKHLEQMTSLHHENVARFYGVCISQSEFVLVNEYCIKGSLEEILQFEPVNLDEIFVASILSDIAKGMTFLHKSGIGIHGNLKSSNCLVTGRWVIKLSDFGLTYVRSMFRTKRDLLWCAPEIINHQEIASQRADIYSFGIILYELVGKHGPFGTGYQYSEKDLQALIDNVSNNLYTPETSWLCCEDYLKNTMISCWQNPPKLRPDFPALNNHLKPFKAILNGHSIVDNILTVMERYQMRLEDLVQERTSQLLAEKKKTENLLHRMLPPQVAEQLVRGKKVAPESFSCITVFFSDICGFTNLASVSTPYQVISLLNDLYTMFDTIIRHYDVYKVETVGDAYLCVSGLPKPNGDEHACEIALMALEFIKMLESFKVEDSLAVNDGLKMRIGVHSGPCVAGVVGVSMPRYTLFGDTVNVASRLETTSEPMKIQLSTTSKQLLDKVGGFTCEKRGTVHLKGKGDMETYWLVGTSSAGNTIPGRHRHNQDTLSVPGRHMPNLLGSYEMSPTNDMQCKHRRTNSMRSVATMQRAGSFRQRERTKSTSNGTSSRSADSLTAICQGKQGEDDEQKALMCADNAAAAPSIVIQVDEYY